MASLHRSPHNRDHERRDVVQQKAPVGRRLAPTHLLPWRQDLVRVIELNPETEDDGQKGGRAVPPAVLPHSILGLLTAWIGREHGALPRRVERRTPDSGHTFAVIRNANKR